MFYILLLYILCRINQQVGQTLKLTRQKTSKNKTFCIIHKRRIQPGIKPLKFCPHQMWVLLNSVFVVVVLLMLFFSVNTWTLYKMAKPKSINKDRSTINQTVWFLIYREEMFYNELCSIDISYLYGLYGFEHYLVILFGSSDCNCYGCKKENSIHQNYSF